MPSGSAAKVKRGGNTLGGKQNKRLRTAKGGANAQAALNRKRAFELRAQHYTYRQIADVIGVSVRAAFNYVNEFWQEIRGITAEKAEMLRSMELETLDTLQARWEPLALHPSLNVLTTKDGANGPIAIRMEDYDAGLKAVDRVLRILDRRAKLLGLDAVAKVEHSGRAHMTLEEFTKRLEEARA